MTATHFGLALLALLLVGVCSSLRVGAVTGERWDAMTRRRMKQWRRERLVVSVPNRRRS